MRTWIAEYNPQALLADGYEEAILGIAERCGQPVLVVYDGPACIEILMRRGGMDQDEATEYFEFNTLGAWAGEMSPLYLWPKPK